MKLSNSKNFKGLDTREEQRSSVSQKSSISGNPEDSPRTKVMCFGTFDLLHPGHLVYLQQAKKHGSHLIVVIARDKTKKLQKKKTLFSEKERLKIIQNLRIVNEAVLGSLNDKLKVIKDKKPDVLCLGYDQEVNEKKLQEELSKSNLFPKLKRMKPYKENKYKSSLLKKL